MRITMILSATLALVMATVCPAPMVAEETSDAELKTVLTVSISGYDAVMGSVDALAKVAGVPEMTMLPKMLLGGPAGPGGLDGSKPAGVVVQTDGQQFPAMGFVPVTDAGEFMAFLGRFVQDIPKPDADGVYEVEANDQTVFIQEKGGWAFVAIDRAVLANTPTNPASLLDGMEEEYALAVRAQLSNVPKELRAGAMQIMQMAAMQGSQRNEGETDEQYAIRQQMTQQSMEGIQKFVNEMDSLTVGLAVDDSDGSVTLDVSMTAIEGTSLADDMADTAGLQSEFAGFFSPNAAIALRMTGKLTETDVTQSLQMLDVVKAQGKEAIESEDLGEAQTQKALEIGAELLEVAKATIEGRTIDGGLSLIAGDDLIALIAGGKVVDGDKLNELFKQVVEEASKEEPDVDQFLKMDVAEHKGVQFHTLAVPAALVFEDGVPPAYADTDVKFAIGFGNSAVFVAHGGDPIALLKAAIDRSAETPNAEVLPMQLSLSAKAIGSLLEVIGASEEADIPAELIAALKQGGDKDHLLISAEAIPNGLKTRLTVEGGFLKVIGAAAKTAGGAGQSGF